MDASFHSNVLTGTNVHIMGLGWLGLPLARTLHQLNVNVSGCVRSSQKQSHLQKAALSVDCFDLYKPLKDQYTTTSNPLATRFANASVVINIPPGRKGFKPELFVSQMLGLIDYAMNSGAHQILFISTTSVFGNTSKIVDNSTLLSPHTDSGKAHQIIEQYLALHYSTRSKVLRPSGLVGPILPSITFSADNESKFEAKHRQHKESNATNMRHPIFTLCHKRDIPNGNDPVNLVHQIDVINAIVAVLSASPQLQTNASLQKSLSLHAYNLAANEHPSRQEYYQWCARQLSLPTPHFSPDIKKRQLGKLIDASSSFTELGITPTHASPYTML